ncbi:MAG: GAF domain-containing protein, partial [Candidatus Poribacteria bacterium]|nr:GAF domain-containing protein [Candidatus Poribacteria bacterium]
FCRRIALADEDPEKRNQEFLDLTADLSTSLDIDAVLYKINTSASKLVLSEASSILLFDDQKMNLYFKTASGGKAPILNRINVSRDTGGIAWWVAQTGEPAIVNDAASDPRFTGNVDSSTGFRTESLIAVPIILEGEILGVLEAVNKRGSRKFTEQDLQLFTSLANQIAIAIRNAQMTENYENFFTNSIELTVKAIESVGELIGLMASGHCWRVAALATALGQQFGISDQEFDDLYYGAALHDIGLLELQHQKPAGYDYYDLTTVENINAHTIAGANIVKEIRLLSGITPIVRHHHEHFDGTGQPDGLKAEQIPLAARIVAIVEAYEEALYSQISQSQVIAEIERQAGTRFDPQVVEVFVNQIRQQG